MLTLFFPESDLQDSSTPSLLGYFRLYDLQFPEDTIICMTVYPHMQALHW